MKDGKTMLCPMFIVGILCIAAMIAGLFIWGPAKVNESSPTEKGNFFNLQDEKGLEKAGLKVSPDGSYKIADVEAYGYEGDASVKVKEDTVSSITFTTNLFSEDLLTADEAKEKVNAFVNAYSKEHGFNSEAEPVLIQFTSDELYAECPEDKYEALIQGYVMFERSYRDSDGVLWIIQIYSPKDNVLVGAINKYPDDSGYADYVPQEIIQKEVVE